MANAAVRTSEMKTDGVNDHGLSNVQLLVDVAKAIWHSSQGEHLMRPDSKKRIRK